MSLNSSVASVHWCIGGGGGGKYPQMYRQKKKIANLIMRERAPTETYMFQVLQNGICI